MPAERDWLAPAEREALSKLAHPKRRQDWLLGRWVAKRLLSVVPMPPAAARPGGLALDQIEIRAAGDGAPEAWIAGSPLAMPLSLSHAGGLGLAVVAPCDTCLGGDLEQVEEREAAWARDFFTDAECAWIELTAPADRARNATLLWSAKESALKALREGLRRDTRSVEVNTDDLGPEDGADLPHASAMSAEPDDWRRLGVRDLDSGRVLHGWWRCSGAVVLTIIGSPRTAGAPVPVPATPPQLRQLCRTRA